MLVMYDRDPKIEGECCRCGRCCLLGQLLDYQVEKGRMRLNRLPGWAVGLVQGFKSKIVGQVTCGVACGVYDHIRKACTLRDWGARRRVCEGWPYSKEDIGRVGCPGFRYVEGSD